MPLTAADVARLQGGSDAIARDVSEAYDAKMKARRNDDRLRALVGAYPGRSVSAGDTTVGPTHDNDKLSDLLRVEQIKNLQDERERKALQDLADRSTKAGTAQIVPALQRAEQAIPGIFTSPDQQKLKSVGGMKNLIPDFLVPVAEKFGMLSPGSSAERTALQELQNVKIYDSSGKQINEEEMKRIKTALGLKGVFSQEDIIPALKQMGYTTLQKQQQVSAGAKPHVLQEFKGQGGLAGARSLKELLGMGVSPDGKGAAPAQAMPPGAVRMQRNKRTGEVRYLDAAGNVVQ